MSFNQIILDYLFEQEGPIGEYQLLQHIGKRLPEFFDSLGASPSLYKKHFLLFNTLYQIDDDLSESNLRLIISPLDIRVVPTTEARAEISETDGLRHFYQDINNLELSEQEVMEMQKQFWQKYLALDKKREALEILDLVDEDVINLDKVKKQYKKLAQQHHPDKGGNEALFLKINEAFEQLKLIVKH